MKLNLSENIRCLRRDKHLTQEQLAEALDVTVGAVSKWESGATTPEIETLVRIADFFDLSVDALLGWRLEGGSLNEVLSRINALLMKREFDDAIGLAEKLLQKHPNSFAVVYQAAMAHFARGSFFGNKTCSDSFLRAQTLLNRALSLFDQNTDPEITEWEIKNTIGETYQYLWDLEKAVKIYRANNINGVNDARIAHIIADNLHRSDEALPYIKNAFQRLIQDLIHTMIALADYYFTHGQHSRDRDTVLWVINALESLRPDGCFCDLDPLIITLMQAMCEIHLRHYYDPALAKDWMKRAYRTAKAYDAAPHSEIVGCRFLDDRLNVSRFHTIFFGNCTIVESLRMRLHWSPPEKEPEYYRIFDEAIHEVDEEEIK